MLLSKKLNALLPPLPVTPAPEGFEIIWEYVGKKGTIWMVPTLLRVALHGEKADERVMMKHNIAPVNTLVQYVRLPWPKWAQISSPSEEEEIEVESIAYTPLEARENLKEFLEFSKERLQHPQRQWY